MLSTFFTAILLIVAVALGGLVLLQQGKGDVGLGGTRQALFGGSGGQSFLEKVTWALLATFILGSLGLTIFKTHEAKQSLMSAYRAPVKATKSAPAANYDSAQKNQENSN